MTAQEQDTIEHKGRSFRIVAVSGVGLFDPADYGLKVQFWKSSCWNGYQSKYAVERNSLRLIELLVGLHPDDREAADRGDGPILLDHTPVKHIEHGHTWSLEEGDEYEWESGAYQYDALDHLVCFSGGLVIGDGRINTDEMPGHGRPYQFDTVIELVFENGRLVRENDHSAAMAKFRDDYYEQTESTTLGRHQCLTDVRKKMIANNELLRKYERNAG